MKKEIVDLKKNIDKYIKKYPLPTDEQNNSMFKRLTFMRSKGWTKRIEYKKLREKLILSNGGFGMMYALRYCRQLNDMSLIQDIFQQSQIGIMEAVDKFDLNKNVRFTTYAFYDVRRYIIDFIKKYKLVSAPREVAKNMKRIGEAYNKLYTNNFGGPIASTEIRKEIMRKEGLDIENTIIDDTIILLSKNASDSENSFITNEIDNIQSEDEKRYNTILKSIIMKELEGVDKDTVEVIKLRFGIDCDRPFSLPEILMIKNLSSEKMEKIKEKTRTILNKIE